MFQVAYAVMVCDVATPVAMPMPPPASVIIRLSVRNCTTMLRRRTDNASQADLPSPFEHGRELDQIAHVRHPPLPRHVTC